MARSCPPEFLCKKNATIGYLVISILAVFAIMYTINNNRGTEDNKTEGTSRIRKLVPAM